MMSAAMRCALLFAVLQAGSAVRLKHTEGFPLDEDLESRKYAAYSVSVCQIVENILRFFAEDDGFEAGDDYDQASLVSDIVEGALLAYEAEKEGDSISERWIRLKAFLDFVFQGVNDWHVFLDANKSKGNGVTNAAIALLGMCKNGVAAAMGHVENKQGMDWDSLLLHLVLRTKADGATAEEAPPLPDPPLKLGFKQENVLTPASPSAKKEESISWDLWNSIFKEKDEATWEDFRGGIQQKKVLNGEGVDKMLKAFEKRVSTDIQKEIKKLFVSLDEKFDRVQRQEERVLSPTAKVVPVDSDQES